MRNEWILDVLADLRGFAQDNNLQLLAEQLDDTAIVAVAEICELNRRSAKHHRDRTHEPVGLHTVRVGTGGLS